MNSSKLHPALTSCRVLDKVKTHSPDWHALRASGIGSSDAGAIIGVSPFSKPRDIWGQKIGEKQKPKPWLADYAAFGTWFETYIRKACEVENGIEIVDGADIGALQSTIWDKALANIDGLDITNGVVEEYKTTTEKWTEIPEHHISQVQHQMFVTGVREVRLRQYVAPMDRKLIPSLLAAARDLNPEDADQTLADWLLEHGEIHTWIVERDESYIERMINRERAFWTMVEMNIEPSDAEPDGIVDITGDPDVLPAMAEYARLVALYDKCNSVFIESEGIEVSGRASSSGSVEKAIKAAKKKVTDAIKTSVSLMEDTPKRLTIGGHKATFVDRGKYNFWNLYLGEPDDVLPF